jgi:hypothetical protein
MQVKKLEEAAIEQPNVKSASDYDALVADEFACGVVPVTDDPQMPAMTFRTVTIGLFWAIFLATCNSLFNFRTSPFVVPNTVAILLSYPTGVFLARVLPDVKVLGISLNPGPFTVKEHVLISSIAASAGGKPYGLNNVVAQYFETLIVL